MYFANFIYNGFSSKLKGYKIVGFSDDSEEFPTAMQREIEKSETTQARPVANHYGAKYTDVLSFSFFMINDTENPNNMNITPVQSRFVKAWVTSTSTPLPLYTSKENSPNGLIYNGVFTNVEDKVLAGNLIAMKLTFQCSSSSAYLAEKKEFIVSSGNLDVNIQNTSDCWDRNNRPILTLEVSEADNSVTITNNSLNKSQALSLQSGTYVIDGKAETVSRNGTLVPLCDLGITEDTDGNYNINFLELQPGENSLTFSGSITKVTLDMMLERKVGSV